MRLIDADELIKYLKQYHSMSQGVISDVEHFPTAHMAIEALEKQATSEWIPCSERLPEIEKEVLVQWRPYLSSDIEMNILVLTKSGEWVCGLGRINGRAIAWMPLPEPYKDGEHND